MRDKKVDWEQRAVKSSQHAIIVLESSGKWFLRKYNYENRPNSPLAKAIECSRSKRGSI